MTTNINIIYSGQGSESDGSHSSPEIIQAEAELAVDQDGPGMSL